MLNQIGECSCGNTKVSLHLPESLDKYSPRKCNCDYCMTRGITYISHPDGHLDIQTKNSLKIQKQGSNQASFLTCSNCKSVIAASIEVGDKLIGSLNSTLLLNCSLLQSPSIVSPKLLGEKEKVERWQKVWLNIKINGYKRI